MEEGQLSLKELIDDPETNERGIRLHVVVDHPVLVTIQDHAYTDTTNEIIGHLGGTYDAEQHVVHIANSAASRRNINELRCDSVEESDTGQHLANEKFQEHGLTYVGWYHSHPRIKPLPSTKDLRMQSELQAHLSFAIGVICAPYMSSNKAERAKRKDTGSTCLINFFRTLSTQDAVMDVDLVAVKVTWAIREMLYSTPSMLHGTQTTLQVTLQEAKAWYEQQLKIHAKHPHRETEHQLKFINFLNDFLTKSMANNMLFLQQHHRNLTRMHTAAYRRFMELLSKLSVEDAAKLMARDDRSNAVDGRITFDPLPADLDPRQQVYSRICNAPRDTPDSTSEPSRSKKPKH